MKANLTKIEIILVSRYFLQLKISQRPLRLSMRAHATKKLSCSESNDLIFCLGGYQVHFTSHPGQVFLARKSNICVGVWRGGVVVQACHLLVLDGPINIFKPSTLRVRSAKANSVLCHTPSDICFSLKRIPQKFTNSFLSNM